MDPKQPAKGHIGLSFGVSKEPPPETSAAPPLRLMVVGDFGGREGPGPFPVDREHLDTVLAGMRPTLDLEVPNRLASHPERLRISFGATSLKDFVPEAVTAQVPELARLAALRGVLMRFGKGEAGAAELRAAVDGLRGLDALRGVAEASLRVLDGEGAGDTPAPAATAGPPTAPKGGADDLDRLLDMVEGPGPSARGEPSAASRALGQVIADIGRGATRRASPWLERALTGLEQAMGAQLDAIFHHPRFQSLESAWRGLALLVRRCDFRAGVRLSFVDTPKEALLDAFRARVYEPERAGREATPLTLAVIDHPIANTPADLGLIQTLGELAEALQVPLAFSLTADFFAGEGLAEVARRHYPARALEDPEHAQWRALREKDCARWLVAGANRLLLRAPYGPQDRGAGGYAEQALRPSDWLWGSPGWGLAALVARSHARLGWPTEVTGASAGRVEDLPLWSPAGSGVHLPVEAALSEQAMVDLAGAGVLTLFSPPDTDSAYLFRAPTLRYGVGGRASPGAQVRVQGYPDPEREGGVRVDVWLRTGRHVLSGAELALGLAW
jgi:type VI secretion system ImpB/VipA family protein